MVSFQTPTSPNRRKAIPEIENLSKKRKWEEPEAGETLEKAFEDKSTISILETELHLETPLPLEWQRCLDIQSGQIHFYNMRTQKRTLRDPRRSPEPPCSSHMSLDLELNLPGGSVKKSHADHESFTNSASTPSPNSSISLNQQKSSGGLTRPPSWLAFEGNQQEMVTAVCMQCHMLVLLCKSSPACPNCKFVNPPNQSPPNLFKRRFSLLC